MRSHAFCDKLANARLLVSAKIVEESDYQAACYKGNFVKLGKKETFIQKSGSIGVTPNDYPDNSAGNCATPFYALESNV